MVKARIGQFQAEGVLPIQAAAYGISGLPIRQVLHKLEDRNQCQAPGRFGRLTMRGKQISKRFIGVNRSQRVT